MLPCAINAMGYLEQCVSICTLGIYVKQQQDFDTAKWFSE